MNQLRAKSNIFAVVIVISYFASHQAIAQNQIPFSKEKVVEIPSISKSTGEGKVDITRYIYSDIIIIDNKFEYKDASTTLNGTFNSPNNCNGTASIVEECHYPYSGKNTGMVSWNASK